MLHPELRRRATPYFDNFPRYRVVQTNTLGMEPITKISRERLPRFIDPPTGSIERISQKRMPGSGQVNPNLVRSPGFDPDLHERGIGAALQDAGPADGAFAFLAGGVYRPELRMRHRPDWCIYQKAVLRCSPGRQCAVDLCNPVLPQSLAQDGSGSCRSCKQNHSRCAAPETVNGCRIRIAPPDEHKKRMLEKSARRGRRKPARLCHTQQFFILVEYRVRKRYVRFNPWQALPGKPLPGRQNSIRSNRQVVQKDLAIPQAVAPFIFRGMAVSPGQVV